MTPDGEALPTGTVTFLFTDLEGSTRLWDEHPEAMKSTLARVEQALDAHAFAEAWALGAEMTIDEAAALAHDELGHITT